LLQGAVAAATIGVGACIKARCRLLPSTVSDLHQRRRLLQGVSLPATRSCGGCYHRRRWLVQGASPAATWGIAGCYRRRRRLLQKAAAAATIGGGGCFKGPRRFLHGPSPAATSAVVAAIRATPVSTWGIADCYHRRRRLLQGATPAATWGIAGCYHRRRRLLHGATSVATWGIAGCYMRPWWRLLQMASTFSGGNLWARGVAAMGFGVAALVPGQQLARCC
jgi:hypothetical protein